MKTSTWFPSGLIDDAWDVVEKIHDSGGRLEQLCFHRGCCSNSRQVPPWWDCVFSAHVAMHVSFGGDQPFAKAEGETAQLAICRAALLFMPVFERAKEHAAR